MAFMLLGLILLMLRIRQMEFSLNVRLKHDKIYQLAEKNGALKKIVLLFILFYSFLNANVIDNANILSSEFKTELSQDLQNLPKTNEIFILTLNSLEKSGALVKLNERLADKDKKIIALIIYPKKEQSFVVSNVVDKAYLNYINTYHLAPYLRGGFMEWGVQNAVDELEASLENKMRFTTLLKYIIGAIIFIVFMIYILIENRKTLSFVNVSAGLFLGIFLSAIIAYPLSMFLDWLFLKFGSIIFLYAFDLAFFIGIAIFLLIFRRATTQTKKDIEENIKKSSSSSAMLRNRKYGSSSHGGGYSSYSGGGGSFGGGGASGSW